jgi:hypothetical protein
VTDPNYKELWSDELQLFHNPNAKKFTVRELATGFNATLGSKTVSNILLRQKGTLACARFG